MKFIASDCATKPFKHQTEGVNKILQNRNFCLFDEMGAGKSKQAVDAACTLFKHDEITIVVVVTPSSVKSVWYDADPDLGQIKKHAWIPSRVIELRGPAGKKSAPCWREQWADENRSLNWLVVGYEWLRVDKNLKWLLDSMFKQKHRALVVFDETSFIKNRTSQQTENALKLAKCPSVVRRLLLNGTPVTQSPMDLWAQMEICDERVFEKFKNFYHFRGHFAVLGGWQNKQVLSYKNLEELQALVKPYAIRRLKSECLDLPAKTFTHRDVPLCSETWKMYQQLRREALIELGDGDLRLEPNAAVRLVRLAQLTSGMLGGKVNVNLDDPQMPLVETLPPDDISSEKLDAYVEYLVDKFDKQATIVWCRFRRERERLVAEMTNRSDWAVFELYGGQPRTSSDEAKHAFSKKIQDSRRRYLLVAQPHAGGLGNSFIASHEASYLSHDYSLFWYLQSQDRVHRPGQDMPVTYINWMAIGPQGQKTIDHIIVKALAKNENIANWTASAWRKKLEAE